MNLPNKPFLQHHKVSISTLSPIHIGCGEHYEPTNYVMDNNCLYYFDLTSIANFLTDDDRKELTQINLDRDPLLRLQKFFIQRKERLIPLTSQVLPVAEELYNKYLKVAGKAANVEQSGAKVVNKLEIARTAFNSHSGNPILPGSSIKGAIRTALLNSLNAGKRTGYKSNEFNKFESELMNGGFENDPMRLVKIGDATFDKQATTLLPRIAFENNIKRQNPKTDQPTKQLLSLMREVIPQFNYTAFFADITIQDLLGVKHESTPTKQFSLEQIAQACNRFYLEIIKKENKRFLERGCLDEQWGQHCEKILSSLEPFLKNNKGMILRIGRHSGAESITLDGVRSIKIMKGPGKPPDYKPEATTDWLMGEQEKSEKKLLPFGWIFIDFNDSSLDQQRQDLNEYFLKANLDLRNKQKHLLDEADKLKVSLKEKSQQLLVQAQQREEQVRLQQQAEIERQKTIANLSDEDKKMYDLRTRMEKGEGKNQGAGCDLANSLRLLVENAGNWNSSQRSELFKLCIELFNHLNIDKKKVKWKEKFKALEN